jgi:hypothetical protein
MAYTDSKVLAIGEGETSGATLGFAASATVVCLVRHPCDLYAVGALVRIVMDTNAASIVVTRRVIPNSDEGATVVATITLPTLTAAGKIVWKAPAAPIKLNAGDELKFVADAGGGSYYWKPWFEAYPRPETKGNNSDFLLSA